MQRNLKVYIAFAVILISMGFLLFFGFNSETMVYYSTVNELKAKGADAYGKAFRVGGQVVNGSVQQATDRVEVAFDIVEEDQTLHVLYNGILPDTFKEGINVMIEGTYGSDGTFRATNVLTKCASKYDPSMETDQTYSTAPEVKS